MISHGFFKHSVTKNHELVEKTAAKVDKESILMQHC